ncbi:hypothetical protein [Mucilaginibacter panaciglaebae]|uniref:Acetyltransferase (GNAT) family protein n=1 Tax=Mucilaginibacter panaciglaebae TaxID=502331 RepID=A0ABP7X2S2_9SPHI
MENLKAIQVLHTNIKQLRDISIETFTETFSSLNSSENMADYLASNLSAERLIDELNTPGSAFYFAVLDDKIIGYLKLNTGQAQTELKTTNSLELNGYTYSKNIMVKKPDSSWSKKP